MDPSKASLFILFVFFKKFAIIGLLITYMLQERITLMKSLTALETQIIDCLSSDVCLLNDLSTTKKLAELKKNFDETQEG